MTIINQIIIRKNDTDRSRPVPTHYIKSLLSLTGMQGFTLIETIISIVVIGIAFLGLAALFTGVFTNAVQDEAMTITTMLAKGEMDRVMGLDFADVVDENRGSPADFSGNFSNYSWQVRVDAVPIAIADDAGMIDYKQVEVRITNTLVGDVSLMSIVTNN